MSMELNIRSCFVNGKRRYRWKYIGDDLKPKAITKNTREDCKKKAQEILEEKGFVKFDSKEVYLNEAKISFDRRLKYLYREGHIGLGHTKDYNSFYNNHIYPFFNNIDIRTIGNTEVNKFVGYLTDKLFQECPSCKHQNSSKSIECDECGHTLTPKLDALEPKTVKKIFNTLSLILQNQVDPPNRKLKSNICKDVNWMGMVKTKRKKLPAIDFEYWTPKKVYGLVEQIERYIVQLVCKILLQTACRPSEVRVLTIKDLINFDPQSNLPPMLNIDKAMKAGTKKVGDTKTINGHRQLVITANLRDEINEYVKTLPKGQEYLFLDKTNSCLRLEAISRGLDKVLAKNGITLPINRKGYFFRHFTASYWGYKSKYKNAIDLAKALGDKSIDFVSDTYIKPYQNTNQEIEHTDFQEKHFS